ncbi:MAG: tryptophan--tRNA ligase [Cenarchaeum sp. SB0661_bin_35]|nr:tryptophan--tRNA ligase [Cenarchaeum sp. SB0667_bin_13]MXZ94016.1 tryptophan--tRNA ligase [Cenarchaeum sp. SB0666_bin_15]MYB47258.1 tryptophan--tRNA ligase [Cenarchaeum sp. SB0662_bin_33]MYC79337.1 tryptophan--tRNA ligase [Cenarchaeum sp. SB0661_bin_35]MYD58271.1 tryptophan--tRNA ligase [Cenarchaeum sp. SB0678_bin_8]MYG32940.1 tryptophan--tRNA ligase [Cenarchaeum sp. SB0677_bin_16]MYI51214.1 tryptophan--tRNA ligase [Cenarchaeum sp. SB0673_bin_9]MYJ28212.1 tryptophan--tRNA ligase [Cenarcha
MDRDFILTPWESEGDIDYTRLVERFGLNVISNEMRYRVADTAGEDHFLLRRKIFFSHRDLGVILNSHQSGPGFFLYTGRGPSGNTHIGHLIPWVFAQWLQKNFDVTMYFQLTDDEKFYRDAGLSLDDTYNLALQNARDFAALGFDPNKTHILINSRHMGTLYPLAAQAAKKINYSNTKASFGFGNDTNIGMIFYTALQSAPCFLERKPVLIPLGVDQDPHFRLTRDIAPILKYPKPALIHNIMIPSLAGSKNKMSASQKNSAVYTTDTPNQIRKKINKYAYSGGQESVAKHRELGGNTQTDVSFLYLWMFFEPDDVKINNIKKEYESGSMLSGELKQILIEKMTKYMEIHQNRRESVDIGEYIFDEVEYKNKMRR